MITPHFDDDVFDAEILVERFGGYEAYSCNELSPLLDISRRTVMRHKRAGMLPVPELLRTPSDHSDRWSKRQVIGIIAKALKTQGSPH